jgi:hypothetical protein
MCWVFSVIVTVIFLSIAFSTKTGFNFIPYLIYSSFSSGKEAKVIKGHISMFGRKKIPVMDRCRVQMGIMTLVDRSLFCNLF